MDIKVLGSNQTEVICRDFTILLSYNTPVAYSDNGGFYRTDKKWSATTSRHINKWLEGTTNPGTVAQETLDSMLEGVK